MGMEIHSFIQQVFTEYLNMLGIVEEKGEKIFFWPDYMPTTVLGWIY